MQLDNTFAVTAPLDQVWETLMAFERVAGCVPGASAVALTDDTFDVTMRVKLGPILMQYKGTLEVVERDAAAHRAVVRGRAQEAKGQGTAEGTIELRLAADGESTTGTCSADVKLSGRAAAMGKGVISKVSEQLMAQFAQNLQTMLNESPGSTEDPGVPERSGETVVEGVETLAAGSRSEGVARDPDDATPGTSAVEQVQGDPAMTAGRGGDGHAAARHDHAPGAAGGDDPGVPARSGDTVVEGVEALAAGTESEGVLRAPDEATPGTSPVEQVEGDAAMTRGRNGSGGGGAARTEVPPTRMPDAAVAGGAQSSPAARVSDRVSASGSARPGFSSPPAEPESLDAVALVRSLVRAQVTRPRFLLGVVLPIAVLVAFLLGRRARRH
jgi:carbon monoxide dehydrogenase subunit G